MITRYSHFFLKLQNDPARGQVQFCYNLIVNYLKKGNVNKNFKNKTTNLDDHLKGICSIRSYYGIFTIELYHQNQITLQIK